MTDWDKRFLDLAAHISTWSKDPSTQVGAVIVNGKKVVGLGYNGFPVGVEDSEERLNNREQKYKFIVHAEMNALLMAGDKARGAKIYCYPSFCIPCICENCCKHAIQAGITEVIGYAPKNDERAARWAESIATAKQMCDEAGVTYRGI